MKWLLVLAVLLFIGVNNTTICSEHGVISSYTGNKRYANKRSYCEYEHPLYMGGVHKFWSECN